LNPQPLTPELLVTQKTVSDPQLSPDGERIAYCVAEISREGEHPTGDIWLVPFAGGEARRFTSGPGRDHSPRWSPDGRSLAFISDRAEPGKPALYTIATDGGEAAKAPSPPGEPSEPRWSPDGRALAFLLKEPETEEEKRRNEERDDARVEGEGLKRNRLHVLDLQSGEATPVTPEGKHATGYDWSPDGARLVAALTPTPREDEWFLGASIELFDAGGGEGRKLLDVRGPVEGVRWSPDGARIAYRGGSDGSPDAGAVWVVEAEGGAPRCLTESYSGTVMDVAWDPDGALLLAALEGIHGALHRTRLDGDLTPLLPEARRGVGSLDPPVSWSADGARYAMVAGSATETDDVWAGEVGGGLGRRTHTNPELEALLPPRSEELSWAAPDGLRVEGLLIYPAGYTEGTRYPCVTHIHGGPAWVWRDRVYANWHDWGHYLASHGYAVLLPNPRGSIGRGAAFTRANYDDIGGGELADILSGVDHVVELGVADPERLVVGGWSWGGYLSAWAITQTDRFHAAIVGAGVTNLLSDQGQNDVPHMNDYYFPASAYTDPLDHMRRSPLWHVRGVTTPTLVLHGEADERVTAAQGRELYAALKYLGKEAQLVTYPREGHRIQERKHQLDLLRRVLAWYDAHLKP
jgi:dipeptidyl aminopeptidase/acylaminoacyl peptidase